MGLKQHQRANQLAGAALTLALRLPQVIEKVAHEVDLEQRLRMQTLTQALIAFGQGIAFFHAGCELLRSKSLDRDSYNSGMQPCPQHLVKDSRP